MLRQVNGNDWFVKETLGETKVTLEQSGNSCRRCVSVIKNLSMDTY